MQSFKKVMVIVVGLAVAAFALAACGGGGGSSSSETSSTQEQVTANEGEGGGGVLAAAEEEIAGLVGTPSEFPVTEKLKEIPKGAKIAMLVNGAPTGEVFAELLEKAAKTMGVEVTPIKAGNSAPTIASAADSAVAMEPEAVIVLGLPIELWSKQAKELQSKGIPIVVSGVLNAEQYGVKSPLFTELYAEKSGKLVGSYVGTQFGSGSNVVIFKVPELEFTTLQEESVTSQLEAVCPTCSVHSEQITLEEVGSTAPNHVVSYLQANPSTNVVVFTVPELDIGVPSALKKAGIDIKSFCWGPGPTQLQYIKEGKTTAGLGVDFPVSAWQLLDQTAREIIGQELTGPESEGLPDMQFLRQKDITFDPSQGWTGYPDFEQRFEELWGVK